MMLSRLKTRINNLIRTNSYKEITKGDNKWDALKLSWLRWQQSSCYGSDEERDRAVMQLQDCLEREAVELNLSKLNLTSLPHLPEFVTTLDISHNRLKSLFWEFPPSLIKLLASNNQMWTLPHNLPDTLLHLDVAANNFRLLPKVIEMSISPHVHKENGVSNSPEMNLLKNCVVNLSNNPFKDTAIEQINTAINHPDYSGPKIILATTAEPVRIWVQY